MERAQPGPGQFRENEALLKKVWYGVGKAVESQSSRAWNERIIKTINEKVLPKLTPEQLLWVSKHHKAIENTATATGIVISSAELMTVFLAAELGVMKIDQMVRFAKFNKWVDTSIHSGEFFTKLHEVYTQKVSGSPVEYAAVAGTMLMLKHNLEREQASGAGSPTRGQLLRHGSPTTARGVVEQVFENNFKDMDAHSRKIRGARPADPAELDAAARHAYAGWAQTGHWGLDGILDFAHINEPNTRKVYRKMQEKDQKPTKPAVVYSNIRPEPGGWTAESTPLYKVTLNKIRRRNEREGWKKNRRGSKGKPFENMPK